MTNKLLHPLKERLNRSLVLRTTLLIVATGVAVGLLAVWAVLTITGQRETERLYLRLDALVRTVERTASIAAYTHDARLAREVASGLLANRTIARISISDDERELVRLDQPGHRELMPAKALRHPLYSPFGDGEVIGQLELVPAVEIISATARESSWFVALVLIVVVSAITLVLIWAITRHVTQPIKALLDELQLIDVEFGDSLLSIDERRGDEISRLAWNVNNLIARMRGTLRAERDLRAQHQAAGQKWRLIFENAETGIFTLSREGVLHDWNPWLALTLGLPVNEAQARGKPPVNLARLLDDDRLPALVERVISDFQPAGAEFAIPGKRNRWLQIVLTPLEGDSNLVQGIANDISESKHALARAHRIAEQDALTGLLNRRGFERVGDDYLRACRPRQAIAVMLIDLDGFKQVNDTFGHDVGDQLLIAVARLLEDHVRQSDVVVRLGGDEFLVLLHDLASPEAAAKVAGKIVDAIARPFDLSGPMVARIGASVGVAYCDNALQDMDDLLRRADEAMYEAKNSGKSCFRLAGKNDPG